MATPEPTPRIIITRPTLTAAALRRAVRRRGAEPVTLPGLALEPAADPAVARAALMAAGEAPIWIVTSPAAVHFMRRLLPGFAPSARTAVFAVGRGTVRALARLDIAAHAPEQGEDSEGLLAVPALHGIRGRQVALIGAPGGRGVLSPALSARGAEVTPVHVYRRVPPRWRGDQLEAVLALLPPAAMLLSSGEALQHLSTRLPEAVWRHLCGLPLIVSSQRLAALARAAGCRDVLAAGSPAPAELVATAAVRLGF